MRQKNPPHKDGVGTLFPDLSFSDPGCFIGCCKAHPGSLRMASFSKIPPSGVEVSIALSTVCSGHYPVLSGFRHSQPAVPRRAPTCLSHST